MYTKKTESRPAARTLAGASLLVAAALLSGCWNGDITNVSLGDVSLGQQLIDLERALEEDAINEEEYEGAREKLIAMYAICSSEEEEE